MASEITEQLYKVLLGKGYPKELCAEIAYKNMNTDYTATRMLDSYIRCCLARDILRSFVQKSLIKT